MSFQFNNGIGSLSFQAGDVDFATYFDGTTALSNGPSEQIIGSQILIDDMQILGPSPDVSGAFRLSDSGMSFFLNGETVLQGGLTNALLILDPHLGMADIQASFALLEQGAFIGSRYLDEHFGLSMAAGLFFKSDLLAATNGLTRPGDAFGVVSIASTAPVPVPGALILFLSGVLGLFSFGKNRRA